MRQARHWVVASGLVTVGATMWTAGCGQFYEECFNGNLCISTQKAVDKPVCPGSPLDANTSTGKLQAFTENCSVFVAAGPLDSSADGTVSHPYNSLQLAINEARGRWVIACNNAVFDESVTAVGHVEVYGGFSCTNIDWQRTEAVKAELAPSMPTANVSSNIVTLTLQNGMGLDDKGEVAPLDVKFQDFTIKAPKAATPGGSSIGVIVDDKISATLVNCDVTAGDGQPGESAPIPQGEFVNGSQPTPPLAACSLPVTGGVGATTSCSDGEISRGGSGGDGGPQPPSAGPGKPGKDGDGADTMGGKGGKGATDTTTNLCGVGQPGADGTNGTDGPGSADFGSLSLTGITGGDGAAGVDGKSGHGGGGGGGASHGPFCLVGGMFVEGPGAGGGGGGSGGCGGKGGGGGKAGGSSIAIISLGPNLTLTEVTLTTGNGGDGGNGADGFNGGDGGLGGVGGGKAPGAGASAGCDGGPGGRGGLGGSGGGGRGGHSIGVLFKATPTMPPILKSSAQGASGAGGSIDKPPSRHGSIGQIMPCWDLPSMISCSP